MGHHAVDREARIAQPLADRAEGSLAVRLTPVGRGSAHGELARPDQRPLDLVAAGAAAEHERAPGAQQAHREIDAERRGAAVENHVDPTVEDWETTPGRAHHPRFHVLGGLLEHLLRGAVPHAVGADRANRHERGVGVAVERGTLAMTPAHARPGGAPGVVQDDDVEVGMQAPEGRDDQPAQRPRPDDHGGITAPRPAQDRVERRGCRLGQDASLVGDAVGGDEHVLMNEEPLAPAAARPFARSDRTA